MDIEYLIRQKEKLDKFWEIIPNYSKYDRFAPRELRNSMIKTVELEIYEEYENTFLAMTRLVFNIDRVISLSDAYDLIEQKTYEIKKS